MRTVLFTLGLLAALATGSQASAQSNAQPQNFGSRLPNYASFGSGLIDMVTAPVRAIGAMPTFRTAPELGKHQYYQIQGLDHPPTYLAYFGYRRMKP